MAEVRFPETERGIGTYRVGFLYDIKNHQVKLGLKFAWRFAKKGDWHTVRNHFNGYLAEWHYPPKKLTTNRCGRGWTRRAALRRLGKNIVRDNLSDQERAK